MTTATATRPQSREALPYPDASTPRSGVRAGVRREHLRTDRGPGGATRAAKPTARGRRAATRRSPEQARRRRALALLAAVALLGLMGGRGIAGALDAGAEDAGIAHAAAPDGASAGLPAAAVTAARPAYVVVADGDTLWDLVGPYAPPGTDPAVYAAHAAAHAGLDPRSLIPGTVIRLP